MRLPGIVGILCISWEIFYAFPWMVSNFLITLWMPWRIPSRLTELIDSCIYCDGNAGDRRVTQKKMVKGYMGIRRSTRMKGLRRSTLSAGLPSRSSTNQMHYTISALSERIVGAFSESLSAYYILHWFQYLWTLNVNQLDCMNMYTHPRVRLL